MLLSRQQSHQSGFLSFFFFFCLVEHTYISCLIIKPFYCFNILQKQIKSVHFVSVACHINCIKVPKLLLLKTDGCMLSVLYIPALIQSPFYNTVFFFQCFGCDVQKISEAIEILRLFKNLVMNKRRKCSH